MRETLNSSLLPSITVLSSTCLLASTVFQSDLAVCQSSPHTTKKERFLWPVRAASRRAGASVEDRRPEETTAGTEEHQADVNSLPPFHGLGRSQPRCLSFSEPDPKEPGLDKDLSAILS